MKFTDLHGYSDFARLYDTAIRTADIKQHPDFGKRHLEVLDIQGGNGILGRRLLADGLEGKVDYTNVDTDKELLKQSPGRALAADSNFLSDRLTGKFDYIFILNHDSHIWLPYMADTNNSFSANYVKVEGGKGLISSILLLQAAAYLRANGAFIIGGVPTEGKINALSDYLRKLNAGMELKSMETLGLDDETAKAFASYDVAMEIRAEPVRKNGSISFQKPSPEEIQMIIERAIPSYSALMVASFERDGKAGSSNSIKNELVQQEKQLQAFFDNLMSMDRCDGFE